MVTIIFAANGSQYEAHVSPLEWPRSFVGPDHTVVEHSSRSYVICITRGEFVAYPINETT